MKTTVESRGPGVGCRRSGAISFPCPRPSSFVLRRAFTLVELLVVIAIIAVLAAFTIPALSAVKKRQVISHTQAEMGILTAAIGSYKDAYGFYPPDNGNTANYLRSALTNQLYYELSGMTNLSPPQAIIAVLRNLNGGAQLNTSQVQAVFHVGGFVNCSKPGSGEDTQAARNFLGQLRPSQVGTFMANGVAISNLVASVGGPDSDYAPVGVPDLNPWRYNSSNPTNNPGGYDLWVQLKFADGTTNLVCNWTKQVLVNSPLP